MDNATRFWYSCYLSKRKLNFASIWYEINRLDRWYFVLSPKLENVANFLYLGISHLLVKGAINCSFTNRGQNVSKSSLLNKKSLVTTNLKRQLLIADKINHCNFLSFSFLTVGLEKRGNNNLIYIIAASLESKGFRRKSNSHLHQ